MKSRQSILRRGLPDWLLDTKLLVVVFLLCFAGVNVAANLLVAHRAKTAGTCAPFPHGPYQPGRTPVAGWSRKVWEQFLGNYESKKMETGYVLDAISRCPIGNCSTAMEDKYYAMLTAYGWKHVILARDADIASGTEGVRAINSLFATPEDMKILADLKQRVAEKWFDRARLANDAAIRLMVEREPEDFTICRPTGDSVPLPSFVPIARRLSN